VAFSRLTLDAQIEILSIRRQKPGRHACQSTPRSPDCPPAQAPIDQRQNSFRRSNALEDCSPTKFPDSPPTPEQTGMTQLAIMRERLESRFFFPILLE